MGKTFCELQYENRIYEIPVTNGHSMTTEESFRYIFEKIKLMVKFIDIFINKCSPKEFTFISHNFELYSRNDNKFWPIIDFNNTIRSHSLIRVSDKSCHQNNDNCISRPNTQTNSSNRSPITHQRQDSNPNRDSDKSSETRDRSREKSRDKTDNRSADNRSSNTNSKDTNSGKVVINRSKFRSNDKTTESDNRCNTSRKESSQLIKEINNEIREKFAIFLTLIKDYSDNNCGLITDFEWNYVIHEKLDSKGFKNFDPKVWKKCFHTYVDKYIETLKKCDNYSSAKSCFAFFEEFNSLYFNEINSFYTSLMNARKEFLRKFDNKWKKEIQNNSLDKIEDNRTLRKTVDRQKSLELMRGKYNNLQKELETQIEELKAFNLIVQAISALRSRFKAELILQTIPKVLSEYGLKWKPDKCERILKYWIEFYETNLESYKSSMKSDNRTIEYIYQFLNIITTVNLRNVFYYNKKITDFIETIDNRTKALKLIVQNRLRINTRNIENIVINSGEVPQKSRDSEKRRNDEISRKSSNKSSNSSGVYVNKSNSTSTVAQNVPKNANQSQNQNDRPTNSQNYNNFKLSVNSNATISETNRTNTTPRTDPRIEAQKQREELQKCISRNTMNALNTTIRNQSNRLNANQLNLNNKRVNFQRETRGFTKRLRNSYLQNWANVKNKSSGNPVATPMQTQSVPKQKNSRNFKSLNRNPNKSFSYFNNNRNRNLNNSFSVHLPNVGQIYRQQLQQQQQQTIRTYPRDE